MSTVGSIADVLAQGFRLWNTKEGRKYADRVLELKKAWREEFNRPDRSQLALDKIEDELADLRSTFLQIPTGSGE